MEFPLCTDRMGLHLWDSCSWLRLHFLDIYIHLSWTHLHQDGFILRMDYCSSCIKHLMLLMENKLGEQVHLVPWENYLIMLLLVRKSIPFLSWVPFVNEVTMNKTVLFFMIIFAVIPMVAFNVQNVHKVVKARKGSMLQALAMLYPFVVLLAGVLAWDHFSPSDVMGNYPHLVILGSGLAFGFLVGRLILAHLCDEPKGLKTNMCMSLFYLPLAIANALTALLNDGVPLIDEFWVLLGYVVYTVFLYLHFATSVIHEITTALGIYCFRITRKEA